MGVIYLNGIAYGKSGGGSSAIDTELDTTSTNAVQNKTIALSIEQLQGSKMNLDGSNSANEVVFNNAVTIGNRAGTTDTGDNSLLVGRDIDTNKSCSLVLGDANYERGIGTYISMPTFPVFGIHASAKEYGNITGSPTINGINGCYFCATNEKSSTKEITINLDHEAMYLLYICGYEQENGYPIYGMTNHFICTCTRYTYPTASILEIAKTTKIPVTISSSSYNNIIITPSNKIWNYQGQLIRIA